MTFNHIVKSATLLFILTISLMACNKENNVKPSNLSTDNSIIKIKETVSTSRNSEGTVECFSFIFPVSLLLTDGDKINLQNKEELEEVIEWMENNEEAEDFPTFKFPLKIKHNGRTKSIRNMQQLERIFESCENGETNEEEMEGEEETEGEEGEETNENNDNEGQSGDNGEGDSNESGACNSQLIGNGAPQEWIKSISGSQEEAHGHFILTCSDGGFIQIGETGFIPNSAKIFVVKTNASGELIWKKEFGNYGHNLGNSVIEVADGYIIAGALNKNSTVIKLNKRNGSTIWKRTFNNGGVDAIEHLAKTPNGFVAVGYVQAADGNNTFFTEGQAYLTFLDNNGHKISGKNIRTAMAHGYRIVNYNNELIISGLTQDAADYALLKTDLSGTTIWQQTYGGNNSDHGFAMDIGADGAIFLSGHTLSGTLNWDTYTMKIDQNGNQIWETKRGNPRGFNPQYIHDEVWDMKATADGGCIIVAGTGDEYSYSEKCEATNDQSDTWHVYLVKFSANGTIEWDKTYRSTNGGDWAGEAIDLTADGGAIIAVDNGAFGFLKVGPL